MSKNNWTELDYIAGAAHELHMSYGNYVAQGMPNLQRFKRRVEDGEVDPLNKKRGRRGMLEKLATKVTKPKAPPKPKEQKPEFLILNCKICGVEIRWKAKGGPKPQYCPECTRLRRNERQREYNARVKEEKLAGAKA